MKVLLTGASSSPGYKTLLELQGRGYEVVAVYNRHPINIKSELVKTVKLDLTDLGATDSLVKSTRPDVIIHMAAYGDVDGCERNKPYAWLVNVEVTKALIRASRRYGVKYFIYLSTDYVFDGEKGRYREDDTPNPVNYYGLTKLVAEEVVRSGADKYAVVRTSAIYGLGMGRKNFGKFLIEALSKGEKVRALIDQWLSPTLNTLLAKAVVEILERGFEGTYHVAGERVSRYEFAVRLARRFGFDTSLIEQARMSDFSWFAKRPKDSSLDCSVTKHALSTNFNSLNYSLDVLYQEWISEVKK